MVQEVSHEGNDVLLNLAKSYSHWLGWSVIPVGGTPKGSKAATLKYKNWCRRRPTPEDLEQMWKVACELGRTPTGIGIIFGRVSGRLVGRDFDHEGGYRQWASSHPDLASRLPTIRTARGYLVLARIHPDDPLPRTTVYEAGPLQGELRSSGAYSLIPPSVHPDGSKYRWITDAPYEQIDVPCVRLEELGWGVGSAASSAAGLGSRAKARDTKTQDKTPTPPNTCVSTTLILEQQSSGKALRDAVLRSIPTGPGTRYRSLLGLALRLRAIPGGTTDTSLRAAFSEWLPRALPLVRTQDPEASWRDLLACAEGLQGCIWSGSVGQFLAAWLEGQPLPPSPLPSAPDEATGRLWSICKALSEYHAGGPFHLACRTAAAISGMAPATAARRLRSLVEAELLAVVRPGIPGRDLRQAGVYKLAKH